MCLGQFGIGTGRLVKLALNASQAQCLWGIGEVGILVASGVLLYAASAAGFSRFFTKPACVSPCLYVHSLCHATHSPTFCNLRAAGRYHLYVAYACPWASRCLAALYLKVCTEVHAIARMRSGQEALFPIQSLATLHACRIFAHKLSFFADMRLHTFWGRRMCLHICVEASTENCLSGDAGVIITQLRRGWRM